MPLLFGPGVDRNRFTQEVWDDLENRMLNYWRDNRGIVPDKGAKWTSPRGHTDYNVKFHVQGNNVVVTDVSAA
jgi:hypothetical protein